MIRIFVVSSLPAVRAGLRALLAAADDCEVVGEAERLAGVGGELWTALDVAVVDAESSLDPGDWGTFGPGVTGPGLVILGPIAGDERLSAELAGRAWGYVPRFADGDALVAAVRAVANGLLAIDPTLGSHLLARAGVATAAASVDAEELTGREHEVLQLVAQGLANKTIAARLQISEHTVKFHVAAILAKLGAGSRTEAVHLGARRGLVVL
ncbi:MAG: response regulator transcription factor [Chloroflexi bacterium]|nr:response regulator transcription factor [Chloroflexota bacterium]